MESKKAFLGGLEFSNISNAPTISQHFCNCADENGNVAVRDSISFEKNIIEKRIGIDVLTGNEDWYFDETTKTYYYFQYNKFNDNIGGIYDKMLCTHFSWTQYNTNIKYGEFQGGKKNQIMFNFDFGEGGVTNFKNWLYEQYINPNKTTVEVLYTLQYPIIQRRDEPYIPDSRFIPVHFSVNLENENSLSPIMHVHYNKYYEEEKNFKKDK